MSSIKVWRHRGGSRELAGTLDPGGRIGASCLSCADQIFIYPLPRAPRSCPPLCPCADSAAGICGDWLVDPSVQGAAISGIELAEAIARDAAGDLPGSVGLPANVDACMAPGQSCAGYGLRCACED